MTFSLELAVEIFGALLVLAAFGLNQFAGLDRYGAPYLALNLVGAAILAVLAAVHGQWGFLLLQGVWAVVALGGLVGLVRRGASA